MFYNKPEIYQRFINQIIMSNKPYKPRRRRRSKVNTWLLVGIVLLILLIFGWLTFTDLSGDTDVYAPPFESVE